MTYKKNTQFSFRRPEQMRRRLGDKPRSIRFDKETEAVLERECKQEGIGFSTLVSQICDDWVDWLKQGKKS